MIGSVRGVVIDRNATGEVLVEAQGVGYRVLVPISAIPALAPASNAFLFTHLHVRDDAMLLYGFPTRDERDTFEALIGATGVAPNSGSRSSRCIRRTCCGARSPTTTSTRSRWCRVSASAPRSGC